MKFALIELNRDQGPTFKEAKNIDEEEKNNLLLFALPTGETKDGAFKLITLQENFYVSYLSIDKNDDGKASVIGFNVEKDEVKFNPFILFEPLKEMVEQNTIPDTLDMDNLDHDQFTNPYSDLEGGKYIMSSMFLLERLIVVGKHEEIIDFLGTLYEATPIQSIPYLSCVTLVESITDKINIQGIEPSEEIYQQLDEAQRDSTIVMLDEKKAFGTKSSPFTIKIANLYKQGEFAKSRDQINEFIALSLSNKIESAADFAHEHNLKRADAKLLKELQSRTKDVREEREQDIYYQGVE